MGKCNCRYRGDVIVAGQLRQLYGLCLILKEGSMGLHSVGALVLVVVSQLPSGLDRDTLVVGISTCSNTVRKQYGACVAVVQQFVPPAGRSVALDSCGDAYESAARSCWEGFGVEQPLFQKNFFARLREISGANRLCLAKVEDRGGACVAAAEGDASGAKACLAATEKSSRACQVATDRDLAKLPKQFPEMFSAGADSK